MCPSLCVSLCLSQGGRQPFSMTVLLGMPIFCRHSSPPEASFFRHTSKFNPTPLPALAWPTERLRGCSVWLSTRLLTDPNTLCHSPSPRFQACFILNLPALLFPVSEVEEDPAFLPSVTMDCRSAIPASQASGPGGPATRSFPAAPSHRSRGGGRDGPGVRAHG